MNPESPRFAMIAGEASGDLLAGSLLASLRERWPDLVAEGIGGPRMAEQGFVAWWPHHKLSLHGYAEVLGHLRELFAIRSRLLERLLADKPDAFVGIDAPDFNLEVERRLKAAGIKTVHFVSPSIWAWRGGRIEKIGRATDLVLCIFPFEPAIYAGAPHQRRVCRPPARQRDSVRGAARRKPRRARHRRRRDAGRAAAGKPSRRDPLHRAAPVRRRRRDEPGAAGPALRRPGRRAACATRSRRCAGSTRPTRRSRSSTAAPTRCSPPATSSSSPAARRRSRRRCSSGRWWSSTSCTCSTGGWASC